MSKPTSVDTLLSDIYGIHVVDNAYASPAGTLTKKQAKAKINRLITEAQIKELQMFRRRDFKFDETYDYVLNRMKELEDKNATTE